MWHCAAYKKSLTIYPDGIAPCCMIKSYRKPLTEIGNPNVFDDLITGSPPEQCRECIIAENRNINSYKDFFNSMSDESNSLQFIDIRNSNLCNLKCRTCGPHASSQWNKEQNNVISIEQSASLEKYYEVLLTPTVKDFYFTGGEPLLISDHWVILEELIKLGYSKNIQLRYNTNLTVLKYKNKDILELWNQFKNVEVSCSIDATGERFNYIRSGACWDDVEKNLLKLLEYKNLKISIAYTVSNLNIWDMHVDLEYFKRIGVPVRINILNNPDIFSLESIDDRLKDVALKRLELCKNLLEENMYSAMQNMINNNKSKHLFKSAISHILYLDKIRNENLFDQLPFKDLTYELLVSKA